MMFVHVWMLREKVQYARAHDTAGVVRDVDVDYADLVQSHERSYRRDDAPFNRQLVLGTFAEIHGKMVVDHFCHRFDGW